MTVTQFQKIVWDYYTTSGRGNLPWRPALPKTLQDKKIIDPYRVWVSEIMLQQTQVDRVIPFFISWMKQFPTVQKLAMASQLDILRLWKGLGYNSRALRMKQCAQVIVKNYGGQFPKNLDELQKLPGIGPYTAGAIVAFAYNQPVVMIETNIRRVFIYHFFQEMSPPRLGGVARGRGGSVHKIPPRPSGTPPKLRGDEYKIHDSEILELVQKTLPGKDIRQWYWALMDYGSFLGRTLNISGKKYNPNVQSKHYTKQSKFIGSDRQIRGKILELLLAEKTHKVSSINLFKKLRELTTNAKRVEKIMGQLEKENFIVTGKGQIQLKK